MILEGTYYLSEPLLLMPDDTGDEKHPVTG